MFQISLMILHGTYLAYTGPLLTNKVNPEVIASTGNTVQVTTPLNQPETSSVSSGGCRRNLSTQERLAKEDPYGDNTQENKLFFLLFFLTIWLLARCIASMFQKRLRTPQTKETAIYV